MATNALSQLSMETLLADAEQSDQDKQDAEADFLAAKTALEIAEQALNDANLASESALKTKRDSEAHVTRLQAEIDALQYLLADLGDNEAEPISDQIRVSDGMETALAAYLADELSAPVGKGAKGFWREGSTQTIRTYRLRPACRLCIRCHRFDSIIGWGWYCWRRSQCRGLTVLLTAWPSRCDENWQPLAVGWICATCQPIR